MSTSRDELFVGFDLGTHALKAICLDTNLATTHAVEVNFADDLPRYNPSVRLDDETGVAVSSPRLFLAALDLACERLAAAGCPLSSVKALSGSAQMHGSVYVSSDFPLALESLPSLFQSSLSSSDCFSESCFALPDCPIWMDTSTSAECAEIEHSLGGAARVAAVTGSRAYERFTGAQILRRQRIQKESMRSTSRVLLISSFLASTLCGKLVPEDVGDASGTNIFEIESVPPRWWESGARVCGAEGLLSEAPVEGWSALGTVGDYFVRRYGFSSDCVCCAWSGDNPNTIAAYGGLGSGDMVISLGTSDTAQWKSERGAGAVFGHTLRSPLSCSADPEYLRMLCYSNGSRLREAVRDGRYATSHSKHGVCEKTWDEFDRAVASIHPLRGRGAKACIGLFHMLPEIVPRVAASPAAEVFSVETEKKISDDLSWAETCRLAVESRALAIAVHSARLEGNDFRPKRVLLAGGGSASGCIPQVLADVLGAPVFALAGVGSAAAGAARRAEHCMRVRNAGRFVSFQRGTLAPLDVQLLASPRAEFSGVYASAKAAFCQICSPDSST